MEWELLEIDELTDGRVFCRWRTIADDGLPLIEGDYLLPETDDIEEEIEEWLRAKQRQRERLNSRAKVKPRPQPRIKRKTAQLGQDRREALKRRVLMRGPS